MDFYIRIIPVISAIISLIGMVVIPIYVYKVSLVNSRKDKYLQSIVELYYRIEEDYKELVILMAKEEIDELLIKQLSRRVTINCTVMNYYVRRFPGYNSARSDLWRNLLLTAKFPTDIKLYESLAISFEDFCWGIKKNKKDANSFIVDPNKSGYVQENF